MVIKDIFSLFRHVRLIGLFVCFGAVLCTVFAVDSSLVMGVVTAKYFWFYGAMGVCSLFMLLNIGRGYSLQLYAIDLLLLMFVGSVLAIQYFVLHTAISTRWMLLLQLLVLYVFFRICLADKALRFYLLLLFVFTALVESFWGLSQLYGFVPSNHSLFKLTGSFFNSGPYAGYLAVAAPLALFSVLKDALVFKRKFHRDYLPFYIRFNISLLTLIIMVLVLPAAMSRAAWAATLVGSSIVLCNHYFQKHTFRRFFYQYKKRVVLAVSVLSVLIVMGGVGAYFMKKDSADGRVLIWKTSLDMVLKHPMGVGMGHFSGAYGGEQASYFAAGKASSQEELVAGSPEYAFNEFLQIVVECGIVPALLLFIAFGWIIYLGFKRKAIGETASFVSLLVFASMSYPFNILPFVIVLVLLIVSILSYSKQSVQISISGVPVREYTFLKVRSTRVLTVFSILIVCATLVRQYPTYKAYKDWNNLSMMAIESVDPSMLNDYERLYPYLSDQHLFLFEYAQCLTSAKQYARSNTIFEQGLQFSCDPMLYNRMGKNFQQMHRFKEAERCYLLASQIVPSRVYPYYLLAKLYFQQGDRVKGMMMAQQVLEKEPKVQSTAIKEMRVEMMKKLAKL